MSTHQGPADKFDIVIGGGGFVGLALARALSMSSEGAFRVAVVDAAPPLPLGSFGKDGRAFALSAASKRLLELLGVWERLGGDIQPITGIDITDSGLDSPERPIFLSFVNDLEASDDGGDPASFMVESSLLLEALSATVAEDQSVTVFSPEKVNGFSADPYGVDVSLDSGSALSGALLVAADGRQSSLRDMAGIKTVGWSYEQIGLVATIAHEKSHSGRAVQHFLPSGPFAILPLTQNRCSLVWTEQADLAKEVLALDDEAFLAHVAKRFGEHLGALSLVGGRGGFPLTVKIARSFKADRFVLAGDAAHGVHPLAGQGLNIAFRDVAALTEVLVDGLRVGLDIGSEPLLTRYERWRRFDSASSAFAMDGMNWLFSNDAEPVRALRDLGLSVVDNSPLLKDFFVREAAGFTGETPRLLRGERI